MFSYHSRRDKQRGSLDLSPWLAAALGVLVLLVMGTGCAFIEIPSLGPDSAIDSESPPLTNPNTSQPLPTATLPPLPPEPWGEVERSYSFEYRCDPYTITLPLFQSSFEYFQSLDRNFYYRGQLPEDWPAQFYLNFLSSEADQELIRNLIAEVESAIGQNGDALALALISLVQNLTYDCDKLFSFVELDGEGFQTYFPYETLYTQSGVCGDTSILLGKIFQELGYGTAYLLYEDSDHMALGIQCPLEVATYVEDQRGYCYIETTGPTRIGVKPEQLGGRDFSEDPAIIPIGEGASFELMLTLAEEMELDRIRYGNRMLEMATCQEIQLYREIVVGRANMRSFENQLSELKSALDQAYAVYEQELANFQALECEGTLPKEKYDQCVAQQAVLQQAIDAHQKLVDEYYQLVESSNRELDQLNQAIINFNYLMDVNNQDCGLVFSEPIDADEEN